MLGTSSFCVLLLCLPLLGQVFPTGDPVMPPSSGAMPLLTPAKFQKLAARQAGNADFRAIHQLPPQLSPDYRIGINFVYGQANHSWILDRDSHGYKLFLDLKGDGDLREAEPFRFHEEDGVRRIDVPMKDGAARWIARFELVQDPRDAEGVSVRMNLDANRFGKALLNGHQIPFRISGFGGRYDLVGNHVSFDREGNGKYESYGSNDRWVNLVGKTYEFHVDPQGASLTLKDADFRQDRLSLQNGSRVSDVSLTDLEGTPHAFLRNKADFTLLEFWDTNCGPCRQEMPDLKALHDKLPRSRFDILGVSSDESEEVLRKYLAKFAIAWPECRESLEGPVHKLFRIEAEPAYFLLSKDGTIIDHWLGSGSTASKIEAALK